jgi:dTDP-glucose 4,6-dehydratase
MIKRAFVIGSNSFTGGHFINYLIENTQCEVIGISRSPEYHPVFLPFLYNKERPSQYSLYEIDVNEEMDKVCSICDEFKPDLIVNYSAQGQVRNSWKFPEQWFNTNCLSIVKLTDHLRKKTYLKRYIAISTPEVYGATSENIKENHTYCPSTPYAVSKLAGDLHLLALYKKYKFPVIFTRSVNVYGIHQQLYRIIPRTVIYLKLGKIIDLHGNGVAKRSFIHVKDVANLTYRAATKGKIGEVYHVSSDEGLLTIANVVLNICTLMGHEFKKSVNLIEENFGQDAQYSLDALKAKTELGWKQQISFEEGLKETIEWIEDNWEFIKEQPLEYIHKK